MNYFTDEELNQFIEGLEQEELYAPKHLKANILTELERQEAAVQKAEQKRRKNARPTSLVFYSAKIIAGMAAAIVLVFTIPLENGSGFSQAAYPSSGWERMEEEPWQAPEDEGLNLRRVRKTVRGFLEKVESFTGNGMVQNENVLIEREEAK